MGAPSRERSARKNWRRASEVHLKEGTLASGSDREAAWTELVRRCNPILMRAIEGVLLRHGFPRDLAIVEDLVEATWLRIAKSAFKKLREWNPAAGSTLRTHLVMIGMGIALSWCRYKATHREVVLERHAFQRRADRADGHLSPVQAAWLRETEAIVQHWEAGLNPLERRALQLWREGKDQATIGQIMNRSQQFVSLTLINLRKRVDQLFFCVLVGFSW